MTGLLMTGLVTKNISMELDLPILTDGMRVILIVTAGCGMKNGNYTLRSLHRALRDGDKHSVWAGWTVVGAGLKNPMLDPLKPG